MKRILALAVAVLMLCALVVLPASAEGEVTYTLEDIKNSGADYIQLNHTNHNGYLMYVPAFNEDGTPQIMGESPSSSVITGNVGMGTQAYPAGECAFIMLGGINNGEEVPAYVQWDASAGYDYFQALVGPGVWGHSAGYAGNAFNFKLVAIDAEGNATDMGAEVLNRVIYDEPTLLCAPVPEGTVSVRVVLYDGVGNFTSSSCVIAQAVLYNLADGMAAPTTGAFTNTPPEETFDPSAFGTEVPDPSDETDPPAGTDAPAGTEANGTEAPTTEKKGCGSVISAGAIVLAAVVAAPVALKKRK